MKRTATIGSLFFSVFTLALWAQAPPQMPKPGPEHQRLHYFVGDWETITEAKPSPFGPGGKITAKEPQVPSRETLGCGHSAAKSKGNHSKDDSI